MAPNVLCIFWMKHWNWTMWADFNKHGRIAGKRDHGAVLQGMCHESQRDDRTDHQCNGSMERHPGVRGKRSTMKKATLTEEYKKGHVKGEKEVPVLFEEADGVYIKLQGKDRKKGKAG